MRTLAAELSATAPHLCAAAHVLSVSMLFSVSCLLTLMTSTAILDEMSRMS